jgi:hypothetical protein
MASLSSELSVLSMQQVSIQMYCHPFCDAYRDDSTTLRHPSLVWYALLPAVKSLDHFVGAPSVRKNSVRRCRLGEEFLELERGSVD